MDGDLDGPRRIMKATDPAAITLSSTSVPLYLARF